VIQRLIFIAAVALFSPVSAPADDASSAQLIVHEWGTFTSLQNEAGETLGGINIDDEPVPQFVHRPDKRQFIEPLQRGALIYFSQGAPRFHPDVTMRLETPVVYFYPEKGFTGPFDVSARFRGGWVTEYYPNAKANLPGFPDKLTAETESTITWKGLTLGAALPMPATKEHVWLAPRRVKAASVTAPSKETEKYLFYRGVANLPSPLRVQRNRDETLSIYAQVSTAALPPGGLNLAALWLVSIDDKLRVAYRRIGAVQLGVNPAMEHARVPASFAGSAHETGKLGRLRAEMKAALGKEGLFDDEAEAMLSTWELSYFKSPGTRLFFTVPREWTDHVLPLSISVPSKITRVMVGRIELVTPTQRARAKRLLENQEPAGLEALGKLVYGEYQRLAEAGKRDEAEQVFRTPLPELAQRYSFKLDPATQDYLDLGRFRDAIIEDEQKTSHTNSP